MQIKNVRFIIAAVTTFSAYAVYVSRVNLSIAIIAMVDDGHGSHAATTTATIFGSNQTTPLKDFTEPSSTATYGKLDGTKLNNETTTTANSSLSVSLNAINQAATTNSSEKPHRVPFSSIFPTSKQAVERPLISQKKFHWNQKEQGHILGAFFYGYILFQIPGARMAEQVGAKWILMSACAGSALISLLFPLSTQLNSIHLLMVLRFVMGLCQSAFFPAAYVLFCRWLPEKERSVLLPIMFIGSNIGSISTYIMSSYLVSSIHGWPSVFYVSGFICSLVTLFWCIFGSNGPEDNWLITKDERDYIMGNVNNQSSETNSLDELQSVSAKKNQNQILDRNNNNNQNNQNRLAVISEVEALKTGLKKSASCCGEFTTMNTVKTGPAMITHEKQDSDARLQRYVGLIGQNKSLDLNNNNNINNQQQLIALKTNSTNKNNTETSVVDNKQEKPELCWSKLLRSVPVWVLILSMYGNEWSTVVLCYELPTYLNTALGFPIEQNGVINSFFQLTYALASPVMSALGAYMLDKHVLRMHKIHVRKLFQSLALFGQLICFVSIPICGSNRGLIIMFMFSAIVFKSCANAGDVMVSGDLSPEYAGTIFAFANSIGNTAGFFVPGLAGAFVTDGYVREQWTPFWLTTAAIMGSSGMIFLLLGETRRQDYSPDHPEKSTSLIQPRSGRLAQEFEKKAGKA